MSPISPHQTTCPRTRLALTLLLTGTALALPPKPAAPTHTSTASDAAWVRTYTIPAGQLKPPTQGQVQGRENDLNWDPRFLPLLKSAFPQKQWFWFDHHHFTPVANLIQTFIGVPGDVVLDNNRYVTADGCVPHDGFDRGMLWIDTGANPAHIIFVATQLISSLGPGDETLWLFSSAHLNWTDLPPAFLTSLKRWQDKNNATGYPQHITIATLVQPSGEQINLTPPSLFYKQNQPGAKQ